MTTKLFKVVFLLFASYIAYLSLTPTDNILMKIKNVDKLIHIGAYSLFSIIGYLATRSYKKFIVICFCIALFGVLIEFGQSFVPGRTMSALDLMANFVGILLGAIIAWKLFPKPLIEQTETL